MGGSETSYVSDKEGPIADPSSYKRRIRRLSGYPSTGCSSAEPVSVSPEFLLNALPGMSADPGHGFQYFLQMFNGYDFISPINSA